MGFSLLSGCKSAEVDESKEVEDDPKFTLKEEDPSEDFQPPSVPDEHEEVQGETEPEEGEIRTNVSAESASKDLEEQNKAESEQVEKVEPPSFTAEPYKETLQVAVKSSNIRKGPHTDYRAITTLSKNTKLEVYEKAIVDSSTWYHIKSGNVDGWISATIVEKYTPAPKPEPKPEPKPKPQPKPQPKPAPKPAYTAEPFKKELEINVPAGRVRSGPGKNYDIQTTLKTYTKLVAKERAKVNGETWYHVEYSGKSGWVSETIVGDYNPDRKIVLIKAPHVRQMPQLPRGSEVTSLSMLLGHAGVNVDKMKLAQEVKRDPTPYEEKDGKIYFGNPNDGFVGDMYSFKNPGLGVYHGPIAELGNKYLPGRIVDLTGQSFDAVYKQLDNGKPVWVIVTSWYSHVPSSYWETWHTPSGQIKVTLKEHSVLVTGYDDRYIYFNVPLEKNSKIAKANFIAGWEQLGKQAISYN